MRNYHLTVIEQLKDQQVRFAPMDKRLEQIDRAEQLLGEVEPVREYPYQFVFFRITGFRTESLQGVLLRGESLQHDLRLFIEDVSSSTGIDAEAVGEPVLTVEDLSKKFGVSTKTINRWRDQGLVSRRFVFDGRGRVGFLQSSVDRFMDRHRGKIERGKSFSQLTDDEKQLIVNRAKIMVASRPGKPASIIRNLASRFGRSPETIRYTIKTYDQDNPENPVFGHTTGPLRAPQKNAIFRAYRGGASVEALASRFSRTRNTIYRIVNEIRSREILEQKFDYMHNPLFEVEGAEVEIMADLPEADGTARRPNRAPKGLPPYLASLYEVPLLTKEQEQHLFRKMNYLKYRAALLRDQLDMANLKTSMIDDLERFMELAEIEKNQIIRANLRLVVSIAKRHMNGAKSFDELISDGNMSLIRAVEKFDYSRGNKFSTYGTWAIMKNFARSIPAEHHLHDRYVTGHEEIFAAAADRRSDENMYLSQVNQMRQSISKILTRLDDRERSIIISRYGLGESDRHTLEQVGNELGVTKERVRQLEVRAMGKLRKYASEERIELPEDM